MMDQDRIKDCLQRLGYKLSDRGQYWQTNAIFRNGDNKTAIQVYKNTGVWKDHVEGTSFSPLKRLVEITLGTNDISEIKKYMDEDESQIGLMYTSNLNKEKIEMEEIYPESCLSKLLPHYKFYNDKGVSSEVLKSLKGGFATSGKLNKRFIFPIYNELGQIHGFSGRDMSNYDGRPKWKHIGKKKSWIYPLYSNPKAKQAIEESGEVILVESIGDLLSLNENGYNNALVTFGLDVSNKLACTLMSLNPSRVIISLNNDKQSKENRGLEASVVNFLRLLNFFEKEKLCICLPTENDFGDMLPEDFKIWEKKLSSIDQQSQVDKILSIVKNISKPIPKSLYKNIKILKNE
tara:strand:+ start:11681 stop:12724 length:1044 start_codon:yes stop_codon:yes gene_type:complete